MGRVFFNTRKNMHALATTYQVLASDSGKVFTIDQDSTFVITLPADQEGLNYKFIVTDAGSGEVHVTSGASNGIQGLITDENSVEAIDHVLIEFVASTAAVGDYINLVNDGTTWLVEGMCSTDGGIVGAAS